MAWWVPVAIGVALICYAFIVLSFTITTVWAVAVGLGIGLILAGIGQIVCAAMVSSWRWVLGIMGVVDIGLGIVRVRLAGGDVRGLGPARRVGSPVPAE